MHELSLAINIIEQVSKSALDNSAKKIISIRLLLGPLSGVEEDALQFCFTEACSGSIAEDCALIIEKSPLVIRCQRCKKESEVLPSSLLCPVCNLGDIVVLSGKEFRIIDMEVE